MRWPSFYGAPKRNDPMRLSDPHPVERISDSATGDAGRDGFTCLSRADPERAGTPPFVEGNEGPVRQGPDYSFDQ